MVSTRSGSGTALAPAPVPIPGPGPRPQVPYPNNSFESICNAAIVMWRNSGNRILVVDECNTVRNLTNELLRNQQITAGQANSLFNAIEILEHSDWTYRYGWENDWFQFRQALGQSGCPGAYFVHLEDDFLP
jgi:hypothetical protein